MQLAKVLVASTLLSAGAAQAADVPEAIPFDIPYGMPITVELAKTAVEAAQAEAERRNWKLAIAVVSPAGDLTYFLKMNDTQLASPEIAIGKARTAARFRRPTEVFFTAMETGHPYVSTLGDGVVASPGGIPIIVEGKLIGAMGCSGGTGAQDAVACQAGINAVTQ